jgi:hypothetical protein
MSKNDYVELEDYLRKRLAEADVVDWDLIRCAAVLGGERLERKRMPRHGHARRLRNRIGLLRSFGPSVRDYSSDESERRVFRFRAAA